MRFKSIELKYRTAGFIRLRLNTLQLAAGSFIIIRLEDKYRVDTKISFIYIRS
jgi:hypothetical protein